MEEDDDEGEGEGEDEDEDDGEGEDNGEEGEKDARDAGAAEHPLLGSWGSDSGQRLDMLLGAANHPS